MRDPSLWTNDMIDALAWLPPWATSLLLVAIAILLAIAIHAVAATLLRRALRKRDTFWRALVKRTWQVTRWALICVAVGAAVSIAPLTRAQAEVARHALLAAFIVLLGWTALTALDIGAAIYLRRFRVDVDDNLLARKHITQVRLLRRAASVMILLITAGLTLMTIDGVRQWGVSLLAAGGAASLIVGLALQPLLTNLIAGIQIAVTQPIRIDDAVIVEKEFGRVEEITATYVVVRLWDLRRLVLPLSYFLQNPFENWTRESASLLGATMLYVDFSAPVARMRERLAAIVAGSKLWDGQVANLAVTDAKDNVMEVRCLVGARNSGDLFDLRCFVREQMIAFLVESHPTALPHQRFAPPEQSGEGAPAA